MVTFQLVILHKISRHEEHAAKQKIQKNRMSCVISLNRKLDIPKKKKSRSVDKRLKELKRISNNSSKISKNPKDF